MLINFKSSENLLKTSDDKNSNLKVLNNSESESDYINSNSESESFSEILDVNSDGANPILQYWISNKNSFISLNMKLTLV